MINTYTQCTVGNMLVAQLSMKPGKTVGRVAQMAIFSNFLIQNHR